MTIRIDAVTKDAQGLPVVSWVEDRNIFAPQGGGQARVTCFIRPDEKTGTLQFVATGSVRHGAFEEARPWELLQSFAISSADQHYYSATDRVLRDVLASKSKSGAARLLMTDGAHVLLANFADERASMPMHLNCADATPVEVGLLHDWLRREFVDRRVDLVLERCDGTFLWPRDKAFEAYRPEQSAPPEPWKGWIENAGVILLVGLIIAGIIYFIS